MSYEMSQKTEAAPRTVLVADDFDDTRLLMKWWLEKRGYRIVEAADGLAAVEAAMRERPDLIIMDIEMPEMNGLTATRRIREQESLRAVPIIAVSAYGAEQWRAPALAAGCDEYLATPFDPDELRELIERFLSAGRSGSAGNQT